MAKNGHSLSHFWHDFQTFYRQWRIYAQKGSPSTWIYLTHVRSRIQAILGPLSHKSMAGRRQKWSIWTKNGQTWQACQRSKVVQKGPKGSKMVNLSVFDHLGPFWALLDPFGPFQTKMNFLPQMGVAEVLRSKKSIFVWNGPKGSRWA